MDYDEFIGAMADFTDLQRREAETAARATLETLGERLAPEQSRVIARELPPRLRPLLEDGAGPERFPLTEFLARVAARERESVGIAEEHARATFVVLGRWVDRDELRALCDALPRDYEAMILATEPPPRPRPLVDLDDFFERVAKRGPRDRARAERATDAVLETLGERIPGREVHQLEERLPVELHAPLDRGNEASAGAAEPLSLDEFVQRVAERESVAPDEAEQHVRAVFATMRDTVGEDAFQACMAQLGDEFRALVTPAGSGQTAAG